MDPVTQWTAITALGGGLICALVPLKPGAGSTARTDLPLSDWESRVGHVVMLALMLAMVIGPTAVDANWWRLAFGGLAILFAACLIQHLLARGSDRQSAFNRATASAYHLGGSLAMVYASTGHNGQMHHDHAGTGAMAELPSGSAMHSWSIGTNLSWPWLAWLLAAFFLADAIFTCVLLIRGRTPALGTTRLSARQRVGLLPHVAMDLGMILML